MVGQLWKSLARCHTCTMEFIIWIVHLVTTEHSFQATLIEGLVMGHQWQVLNQRLDLLPNLGEYRSIFCITTSKTMHLRTPIIIIIGLWLNQGIEVIHDLSIPDDDHTNGADTGSLIVGSLEIWARAPQCRHLVKESPGGSRRWGEA